MHRTREVRRPCSSRSLRFFIAPLALLLLPAISHAQDVAEAARQEKARKAADAKKHSHVYSNDDLKRSKILTPEDSERVEARKREQTAPTGKQPTESLDAANPKRSESLGEVARRNRSEKAAREAEQALKTPPRAGFSMTLPQPALAARAPLRVPPVSVPAPPLESSRPPVVIAPGKRDPFSRPSRAMPSSPPARSYISAPAPPVVATPQPSIPVAPPRTHPVMPAAPRRNIAPLAPVVNGATVTVRPGDSLWKLARLHLGKGARWHEWLAANPSLVDPDRIEPGTSLILPETARSRRTQPAVKISVQIGDSLWKIAKAQLGSGAHWLCIAEANPQLSDADHIYPGQTVLIPATCRPLP